MLQFDLMLLVPKLKKIIIFSLLLALSFLSFSQGKIIMNGATMTMNNSVYVTTKDVSLTNPSTINVNNSTIRIAGTIVSGNNINVQDGTVEMFGITPQTIPGNSFTVNKLKNLIISNNVTLAGEDSLTGILSFGGLNSKTFSTGGYLTLKSSAAGTATVADLTNNNSNNGNQVLGDVNVERYFAAIKKWRFLSIPTNSTQTIKAAWQEGCGTNRDCLANYGTTISGAGGVAAGFDVYSATPSMKTYDTTTTGWSGVSTTDSTLINSTTNNTIGYMLFVRGDRTDTMFTSPVSETTLRTRGVIKQDVQATITIASPATAFTVVGNPYPSRIDLRRMTPTPTTSTKIYVWDALATIGSAYGYGAYQTLTFNGSDFSVTPGDGSYGPPYNQNPNYIESGSAFFVGGRDTAYNIFFREDVKPSLSNLISSPIRLQQSLQANLFIRANGAAILMDGTKADIGTAFSKELDNNDAYKILNISENAGIKRNGKILSVERYNSISEADTFHLNLTNLRVQNYQWQLTMQNLNQDGLSGFFIDNYKSSRTPLALNGSSTIDFSVENIPGSYAPDRFSIVFADAKVLPLTFTNVKAYQQANDINVDWKVSNESNVKQYEVEKSVDGNNYAKVSVAIAKNTPLSLYSWIDSDAVTGYNYYRIKSVNLNGKVDQSSVVKVLIVTARQSITVYPNPIKDAVINLQMERQPAGAYGIKLMNTQGQIVLLSVIQHLAGTSTEKINLEKGIARGIYTLEVITPADKVISNKLIY